MSKNNCCSGCGKQLPDKLLFSYVDESNIAITKNSPYYCWRCYNEKYPHDKISLLMVLTQTGHKVTLYKESSIIHIDGKRYTLPIDVEKIIKEYDL